MANFPRQQLYIDGTFVTATSGELFTTINPANGEVLAEVEVASLVDIDRAVKSAKQGQQIWAALSGAERGRILNRAVEILRARNDEIALIETYDTGKPLSETKAVDIATGADVVEYYAGLAVALEGSHVPLRKTSFFYTRREPLGVVAGIGAWNYPIQIAMWKAAPALAAGNAMIFKPSEVTPLTAPILAEILTEAGLPDGVFNVVQGGADVGRMLSEHPEIAKISFTGSVATGKKVMSAAALSSLKQVTMELGGKSALIILADADLNRAADIAMMANFYSSGQVCTNGTRVFVPRHLLADFEAALLQRVAHIRMGNPCDEATNFGPLVSFAQMSRVLGFIEQGRQQGARLLCGGARELGGDFASGAFVQPTIFSDCRDEQTIVREEIFGPVMCLLPYGTVDEAVARANATIYGLAGGVVTRDIGAAQMIIDELQAGICWINCWGESPAPMPVGGYKQSGIGRENGLMTLHSYTQVKSVQVELGAFPPPSSSPP